MCLSLFEVTRHLSLVFQYRFGIDTALLYHFVTKLQLGTDTALVSFCDETAAFPTISRFSRLARIQVAVRWESVVLVLYDHQELPVD